MKWLHHFDTGSFIEVRNAVSDDDLQAEFHEASKPPSEQGEEEQKGAEAATSDSQHVLQDSEDSDIQELKETEKDADGSPNEWEDINLVIMWHCVLTYC